MEEQEVVFVTGSGATLQPGDVQVQSGTVERVVRSLGEVKKDWQVVIGQVADMIGASDGQVAERGFRLSEVEVGLGFDARGKLAFIAEAGVEATVTVRFERAG